MGSVAVSHDLTAATVSAASQHSLLEMHARGFGRQLEDGGCVLGGFHGRIKIIGAHPCGR